MNRQAGGQHCGPPELLGDLSFAHSQLPVSTLTFHLGSSVDFWEPGSMQHVLLRVCLCNYGQLLPVRAAGTCILSKFLSKAVNIQVLTGCAPEYEFHPLFSVLAIGSPTLKQGRVFHCMLELQSPEHTSWPEVVLSLLNVYMCSSLLNKLYV